MIKIVLPSWAHWCGSTKFDECGSGSRSKNHKIDFSPSFKSREKKKYFQICTLILEICYFSRFRLENIISCENPPKTLLIKPCFSLNSTSLVLNEYGSDRIRIHITAWATFIYAFWNGLPSLKIITQFLSQTRKDKQQSNVATGPIYKLLLHTNLKTNKIM